MNAMRTRAQPAAPARVVVGQGELMRRRLLRALKDRVRYRYVQPDVVAAEHGWVIVSPCCSRNIDPEGGVIDIAWLEPQPTGWRLYARNHAAERWVWQADSVDLQELMALVCEDTRRIFWP